MTLVNHTTHSAATRIRQQEASDSMNAKIGEEEDDKLYDAEERAECKLWETKAEVKAREAT